MAMLSVEALNHYNTGFEIGDIFGKGRMKELLFNMKEQLAFDQSEIDRWREVAIAQADVINKLYDRLENQSNENRLREENDDLYCQLTRALEMQESLREYASSLEKKLEESSFSDREAYRILKAMRTSPKPGVSWMQEEVS